MNRSTSEFTWTPFESKPVHSPFNSEDVFSRSQFDNLPIKPLTKQQLDAQVDWLNTWDQLRNTAIPIRFYETFSKNLDLSAGTDKNHPFHNKHPRWLIAKLKSLLSRKTTTV